MIWQTLIGALFLVHIVGATEHCEAHTQDYLTLDLGERQDLAIEAMTKTLKFVCKYGKRNAAGECVLQPQCISERLWLSGNLTTCLNDLIRSGTAYDSDYLYELIMFIIAKVRVFFWRSGLPLQIEFDGPRRNGNSDRIMLLMPIIYEHIIEHYIRESPAQFTFPLPDSFEVKQMITKILDLSCGGSFSHAETIAVQSSLNETLINRFVLLFLNGPISEQLKNRPTYNNLMNEQVDENDVPQILNWWRNLLKLSTDPTKELMSGCPNPTIFSSRDQSIRTSFKQFINNLKKDHMDSLRQIRCNDMGMLRSGGGGGRSCSNFRQGDNAGTIRRMIINYRNGARQGDSQQGNNGGQRQWNFRGQGQWNNGNQIQWNN